MYISKWKLKLTRLGGSFLGGQGDAPTFGTTPKKRQSDDIEDDEVVWK
jgi:hypothetical protein